MRLASLMKKSKPAYDRRTRHMARKKALEVIEEISIHRMGMCETEEEKAWALAYEIVHVALGNCGTAHEEWDKKLNEVWEESRGPQ